MDGLERIGEDGLDRDSVDPAYTPKIGKHAVSSLPAALPRFDTVREIQLHSARRAREG